MQETLKKTINIVMKDLKGELIYPVSPTIHCSPILILFFVE